MTYSTAKLRACVGIGMICLSMSCNTLDLGSVAGLLMGNTVTIVIENETPYTAVPDIRVGSSRNFFEDLFTDSEPLTNFGTNGAIEPNQSATLTLACDGDLERIVFNGASFLAVNAIPFGETDDEKGLRRDVDFDCGDTIRIRLTGFIIDFDASISVDRTGGGGAGFFNSGGALDDDESDDIADFLDDLFGS